MINFFTSQSSLMSFEKLSLISGNIQEMSAPLVAWLNISAEVLVHVFTRVTRATSPLIEGGDENEVQTGLLSGMLPLLKISVATLAIFSV